MSCDGCKVWAMKRKIIDLVNKSELVKKDIKPGTFCFEYSGFAGAGALDIGGFVNNIIMPEDVLIKRAGLTVLGLDPSGFYKNNIAASRLTISGYTNYTPSRVGLVSSGSNVANALNIYSGNDNQNTFFEGSLFVPRGSNIFVSYTAFFKVGATLNDNVLMSGFLEFE